MSKNNPSSPKRIVKWKAADGVEYLSLADAKMASERHRRVKSLTAFFEANIGDLTSAEWKTADRLIALMADRPKLFAPVPKTKSKKSSDDRIPNVAP